VFGNVFATIDRDMGRFTMSVIMHREVEGLFRQATKRGREVATWMPQKKIFVAIRIIVFDFDLFIGVQRSDKYTV
jgi:hypothetical protein